MASSSGRRRPEVLSRDRSESRSRIPDFLTRDESRGEEMVMRRWRPQPPSSESSSCSSFSSSSSPPPERRRVIRRARSTSLGATTTRTRLVQHDRSQSPEKQFNTRTRARSSRIDRYQAKIDESDKESRRMQSRSPSPRRSMPTIRRHADDLDVAADVDVDHHHHGNLHHTDIDIDIHHSPHHSRSRSRHHSRHRSGSRRSHHLHDDQDLAVRDHFERIRLEDARTRHRSHSAAVPIRIRSASPSFSKEANYITSRIDSRGAMGEAHHGHTQDWALVDVPPGTERVRMNGIGGAAAEVTWRRWNGVRHTRFLADGNRVREREPRRSPAPDRHQRDMADKSTRSERDSEMETSKRRARRNDTWTEITKDLVCKEAMRKMSYQYDETEFFYYIMEHLENEDVVQLVNLSDIIREDRRKRARETEWKREQWERDQCEYHDNHDHVHVHHPDDHFHRLEIKASHNKHHRRRSHTGSHLRSAHWSGSERDVNLLIDHHHR